MSADNGIYILKTIRPVNGLSKAVSFAIKKVPLKEYEYRVRELQGVESVRWDSATQDYNDDPDVMIKNARKMWAGCKVYRNKYSAFEEADKLEREVYFLEYGTAVIEIDREF